MYLYYRDEMAYGPSNLCNGIRFKVKFLRNNVIIAIVLTKSAVE